MLFVTEQEARMSSSFWAGYWKEGPRVYRKGRDVVRFSEDGLHAEIVGPEGISKVKGEGAVLLRQFIEEDAVDYPYAAAS